MSTRLRMLVIWSIAISACISSRPDEAGVDAGDTDSQHPAAEPRRTLPIPRLDALRDAGASRRDAGHFTSLPVDEIDADEDAGIAELADSIELDCRETLRCNADRGQSVGACIAAVTDSLAAAPPDARARFRAIIQRCEALHACAYVMCTMTR